MAVKEMTWEEAQQHVGVVSMEEIEERALHAVPHYIWMERRADTMLQNELITPDTEQKKLPLMGFCTNCMQWHKVQADPDWVTNDPYNIYESENDEQPEFEGSTAFPSGTKAKGTIKHGNIGYCHGCGAKAQYRHLSIGYKTLYDRTMFITYRKSAIESDAIVMVAFDVINAWKHMEPYDRIYPPMDIEMAGVCVFRYGKGADRFIVNHCGIWNQESRTYEQTWNEWPRRKECKSGWVVGSAFWGAPTTRVVLDRSSMEDAIAGTQFERIAKNYPIHRCKSWEYFDKITAFAKLAKYPCIEYLYKLGFEALANYAIDEPAGKLLNLRGKTAKAVLRLTEQQWGEVKGHRGTVAVTPETLKAVQYAKAHKLKWNIEMCSWIGGNADRLTRTIEEIRVKHPQVDTTAIIKYCRKRNIRLYDYRDYLHQMEQLRMNMKDKTLLYPRDFDEMHARLSERIAAKANRASEKKIKARLPELSEYCFSAHGLVLRPMLSAGEVVREGNMLRHCVADYVGKYANGSIVLCCLREETTLNKPLYTVEFGKNGQMVQCRGFKNQTNPDDVERLNQFWQLFEMMRTDLRAQRAKDEAAKKRKPNRAERKTA